MTALGPSPAKVGWPYGMGDVLDLLAGRTVLPSEEQTFVDWIGREYGSAPVRTWFVPPSSFRKPLYHLDYDRTADVPPFTEADIASGGPVAHAVGLKGREIGLSGADDGDPDETRLVLNALERTSPSQFISRIDGEAIRKAIGDPRVLRIDFHGTRLWTRTDVQKAQIKDDGALLDRIGAMGLEQLRALDLHGGANSIERLGLSVESQEDFDRYENPRAFFA